MLIITLPSRPKKFKINENQRLLTLIMYERYSANYILTFP